MKKKKAIEPSAVETTSNQLIENVGKTVGKIDVEISYHIIELFSAGLYSSPNKAFEELVSNAYDANAKKVCVNVPADLSIENATLWVCDNGESMNSDGLKQLWKIGSSNKRDNERRKARLQIGRFGIGKLATYVLASKLTYICKNNNKYLAVTMDYSKIDKGVGADNKIKLDERELKLEEVRQILEPMVTVSGESLLSFNLWGSRAEKSWTMVIMSLLKPKAREITEGRLQWVLKTALPINPDFSLFYNGSALLPSKIKNKIIKTWEFAKNDDTAKRFKEYKVGKFKGEPVINFEHLKNVRGRIDLYDDSLLSGKAEKTGRSHGIFLMVRGRLINTEDPLLGLDAFSHGAFNRTRIIVYADGLDDLITSTRESIKDSLPLTELKGYIKRKFNNEVRVYWLSKEEKAEKAKNALHKVSVSPNSLTRRPLLILARKFFDNEITEPLLTKIPSNLTKDQKLDFLSALEKDLTSEEGIIESIEWGALQPEDPIAVFDMQKRVITVNLLHPFLANFSEDFKDPLPLQLIAVTEVLTEAQMIEIGISQSDVKTTLFRRDQTLRELTYSDKPNAPAVATMLRDSIADPSGFENALFAAFNSLGFDTEKIGGNGKPDGKAVAHLGYSLDKKNQEYVLLYEAKSTKNDKISAADAKISASVRHRDDYKANYSVTVARNFEGAEDPNSAISKEAFKNKVTLIRAKDLLKLVLISSPRQVGLNDLKDLLENCFTVFQTSRWIESIGLRPLT